MTVRDANGKILRLSPSMLATAGKCGMQVKWFYLERLRRPPGFVQELGKAYHAEALGDRELALSFGLECEIEELRQNLTDRLRKVMPEIPDNDDVIAAEGGKEEAYARVQERGFGLLDEYDKDRSRFNGEAYELEFSVPFAGETLHGFIDIDVEPTKFKDVKTRDLSKPYARRISQPQVSESLQFRSYSAAKMILSGEPVQHVEALYAYTLKKGAAIETMEAVHGMESHRATEDFAYRLYRAIESDSLLPVDKSSQNAWVCSAKFCGAWEEICPFGRRSQVSV